jgi:hypothetical protein
MTPVPDGFGSPPSHSSLLLPPPLLHYKTQIDRQTDRHRERDRDRDRAQQRREEAGSKSNREGECSATAATVLSKERAGKNV